MIKKKNGNQPFYHSFETRWVDPGPNDLGLELDRVEKNRRRKNLV